MRHFWFFFVPPRFQMCTYNIAGHTVGLLNWLWLNSIRSWEHVMSQWSQTKLKFLSRMSTFLCGFVSPPSPGFLELRADPAIEYRAVSSFVFQRFQPSQPVSATGTRWIFSEHPLKWPFLLIYGELLFNVFIALLFTFEIIWRLFVLTFRFISFIFFKKSWSLCNRNSW